MKAVSPPFLSLSTHFLLFAASGQALRTFNGRLFRARDRAYARGRPCAILDRHDMEPWIELEYAKFENTSMTIKTAKAAYVMHTYLLFKHAEYAYCNSWSLLWCRVLCHFM